MRCAVPYIYKYMVLPLFIYIVYTLSPTPIRVFGIFGEGGHSGEEGWHGGFRAEIAKVPKTLERRRFRAGTVLAQRWHSGVGPCFPAIRRPPQSVLFRRSWDSLPKEGWFDMTPHMILQTALGMLYAALFVTALVRLSAWLLRVLSKGRVDLRCSWRAGMTVTLFTMLSLMALSGLADLLAALAPTL